MNGTPQTEDGFMQVATELHAALCKFRIPGEARQVLDAIMLKTYGFHKREDAISLSQLSDVTGMPTSEVCRALRKLLSMNIIGKKASRGMNVWHINKHYGTWKVLAKKPLANSPLAKKPTGTGESANQVLAKKPDTKDTSTKDNIQKITSSTKKGPRPSVELVMNAMRECFAPLDDSEQNNRRYAWLLIQQALKNRPGSVEMDAAQACASLIRMAKSHDWWGTRITKVADLYRNAHKITNAIRGSDKAVFIS